MGALWGKDSSIDDFFTMKQGGNLTYKITNAIAPDEAKALWKHYDKDGNGVLDKAELLMLMTDIARQVITSTYEVWNKEKRDDDYGAIPEELRAATPFEDKGEKNRKVCDDLLYQFVHKATGDSDKDGYLQRLVKMFDEDKDGQISMQEFLNKMQAGLEHPWVEFADYGNMMRKHYRLCSHLEKKMKLPESHEHGVVPEQIVKDKAPFWVRLESLVPPSSDEIYTVLLELNRGHTTFKFDGPHIKEKNGALARRSSTQEFSDSTGGLHSLLEQNVAALLNNFPRKNGEQNPFVITGSSCGLQTQDPPDYHNYEVHVTFDRELSEFSELSRHAALMQISEVDNASKTFKGIRISDMEQVDVEGTEFKFSRAAWDKCYWNDVKQFVDEHKDQKFAKVISITRTNCHY